MRHHGRLEACGNTVASSRIQGAVKEMPNGMPAERVQDVRLRDGSIYGKFLGLE
jgi:hypothetical protein